MAKADQPDDITRLLNQWREGDHAALEAMTPLIYAELRKIAAAYMQRERDQVTLQPTALIHEAHVRLVDQTVPAFHSRTHFFGIAARLMRQVLVDFARSRQAVKRGEGQKAALTDAMAIAVEPSAELLDLNEALDRLAATDERKAKVIELSYFGGLSYGEVAEALDISIATVKRDLTAAETWLRQALGRTS
jgi:RNA polymerase sigma factor (TIGR02999 family)